MARTSKKAAQPKANDGDFVTIKSTNGRSRRRAGYRFTPEGVDVAVDDLTSDQKIAIAADPHLKVLDVNVDVDAADA